ncbi:MAG: RnfABCDGE type electron transport complex subunit D [Acetobacteraceae bacterium]|nr:RnfABCDGE type electron transport complex subunit D [Acetobacteraceae bacterium]
MAEAEGDLLTVAPAPHLRSRESVPRLMRRVLEALTPASAFAVYLFGWRALMLMGVAVASAVGSEAVYQRLVRRPVTVGDLSAAVTGLLLALNLPGGAPWWLAAVGSAFAIVVAKQLFGGLGRNFINPALAARAFLLASWPVEMTSFLSPFDGVTRATPLAVLLPGGQPPAGLKPTYLELFLGTTAGCLGETSDLLLLAGAAYLIWRRAIDWRIPAAFMGSLGFLAWAAGGPRPFSGDLLYHLLAGGATLGAFYMATDYVTAPITPAGRVIAGAGAGVVTFVIRTLGAYPEGVAYGILTMNVATPLLERLTVPPPLGGGRGGGRGSRRGGGV